VWRGALGRLMANYSAHERQVDAALIDALKSEIDSRRR
jgi:hypothetical protein